MIIYCISLPDIVTEYGGFIGVVAGLFSTVGHCLYLLRRYVAPLLLQRGKHKCLPYKRSDLICFEILVYFTY